MKHILTAIGLLLLITGCRTGTQKLVTTEIRFKFGTNELSVSNPKDTSWEDLMVSPIDGTVRIKKYRSSANEAAIAAAEKQAETQIQMINALKDQFERGAETAARMYGINLPPNNATSATKVVTVTAENKPIDGVAKTVSTTADMKPTNSPAK